MSSIPDTLTVRRLCVCSSRSGRPQPPTPAKDAASDLQLPRWGGWDSNPRPGTMRAPTTTTGSGAASQVSRLIQPLCQRRLPPFRVTVRVTKPTLAAGI
jgi:hypothetical protein